MCNPRCQSEAQKIVGEVWVQVMSVAPSVVLSMATDCGVPGFRALRVVSLLLPAVYEELRKMGRDGDARTDVGERAFTLCCFSSLGRLFDVIASAMFAPS